MLQWKENIMEKNILPTYPTKIYNVGVQQKTFFKDGLTTHFQFSTLNYQCPVLTQMWAYNTTKLLRTESYTTKLSKVGRNDQGKNIRTVESGNIARPFIMRTLHSALVWLYLWSSVSIFVTSRDSVLLSMENTNLYVPSLQFGRNFDFNVKRKNPNISEWNYELKPCRTRRYYDSNFSLAYNNAK